MKNLHSKAAFNGNVLVAKDGKILYQNTFGWANYLKRDSLAIDDKFELASVTKPITAVGVLKLVEAGKLRLDQTINDFYPDFPYPGITIKMLLTHRSVYLTMSIFRKTTGPIEKRNDESGCYENADRI
ncbi:serine hydrolase [Sphingobacterium sp. E70]|uniref:serine hydrolase domain-containing protein n=1 Tax=Sphingobacterium sp. E70 TaxID=2853439 RepID=UPI00211C94B5|nr:serine hydrolase domain-containing protein [Sphingobacterium sp. E70]